MADPITVVVFFDPAAPVGEQLAFSPEPVPVPFGEQQIEWVPQPDAPIPFGLTFVSFDKPQFFKDVLVTPTKITVTDMNSNMGVSTIKIKYNLAVVDGEGRLFTVDPEIHNDPRGGAGEF